MGIPWGMPEIQWFCLKQPILSILSIFHLLKTLKNKFCDNPLWICVNLVTITWLSPLLSKKVHRNTLKHTWDTMILLKTAYNSLFEAFLGFSSYWKIYKNKFCCKPLWICLKLVTITWLSPLLSKKLDGNTLRHTWDTVILLKTT